LGVVALAFSVQSSRGQDRPRTKPDDFAKLRAPAPEHKHLQALVGKWVLTVEGSKKTGAAEFTSLWDGLFVTETATLPYAGLAMEWRGIYGYDKSKKKYTAVWVDNMDTNTETAEGDIDPAGKVLTFRGQHEDPRTGAVEKYLWRISLVGDANLKIAMLGLDKDGKEVGVMEIRGERLR
jgi:hypothetical protein